MQKEKKVRAYTRKTKSGKTVTVKAHTAKYDAAEAAREAFAKKKGAGEELKARKSHELFGVDLSKLNDEQFKEFADGHFAFDDEGNELQAPSTSRSSFIKFMKKHYGDDSLAQFNFRQGFKEYQAEKPVDKSGRKVLSSKPSAPKGGDSLGFSQADYKAWYHWDMVDDPKNASALKVKKALVASMGPRAYKKYEDQMSESYSSRGDKKAFGALPELVSARTEARNARAMEKLHKGQKALAENLGAKDAAEKFDARAKEQAAKRKAAENKYSKEYPMHNQKKAEKAGISEKTYSQYAKLYVAMEDAHDNKGVGAEVSANKRLGAFLRGLPKEHQKALETETNIKYYEKGGYFGQ